MDHSERQIESFGTRRRRGRRAAKITGRDGDVEPRLKINKPRIDLQITLLSTNTRHLCQASQCLRLSVSRLLRGVGLDIDALAGAKALYEDLANVGKGVVAFSVGYHVASRRFQNPEYDVQGTSFPRLLRMNAHITSAI